MKTRTPSVLCLAGLVLCGSALAGEPSREREKTERPVPARAAPPEESRPDRERAVSAPPPSGAAPLRSSGPAAVPPAASPSSSGAGSHHDATPSTPSAAPAKKREEPPATQKSPPAATRTANGETYGWRPSIREADLRSFIRGREWSGLDYAQSLRRDGQYANAIKWAEEALQSLTNATGRELPQQARGLGLLGELYWLRGDFENAESRLRRALTLYDRGLVTGDSERATLLNKLAALQQSRGQYGQAESLHKSALEIQEATLGTNHVDVADSLYYLAILYKTQGLYGRAESLHRRALFIRQTALGTAHPDVAPSLIDLAAVHKAQGRYNLAEPLVQAALRIQEISLGERHPDVALSLVNLAAIHGAQARYSQAEPLVRRALKIQEAEPGKQHPLYAASLDQLAILRREQGALAEADELAQRALATREAALGEHHPDVAASLMNVALIRVAQERLDEAVPLFTRALTLFEERLRREAPDFSESRLAGFLQYLRTDEERLYSLARAHPEHPGLRRLALTAALLWKGRSAQETAKTSRMVYRSLAPEDRETFARLRDLRSQLVQLTLEGPDSLDPAEYRRRLKELTDKGDGLEATLAERSSRMRALVELPSPGEIVTRVAAALPRSTALVELIAYADHLVQPAGQLRYLALVLRADGTIHGHDLGPARPIDDAAGALRDALANKDTGYQARGESLHALVFQPLRPLLGDARTLYLSPDGLLSLVPFAAIHDGGGFLGKTFTFSHLTSGKDLLQRAQDGAPSRSVVVLADPDFGTQPPGAPAASEDDALVAQLQRSYSLERDGSALRFDAAASRWVPLPGTRREARALQRLFPGAQVYLGPEATKAKLLQLVSPGILHIATHGFFLDGSGASAGTRTMADVSSVGGPRRPPIADPLLRSGLVLAGALAPAAGSKDAVPSPDRTLVTALELAGLNLWGTQLVVLSACDTGRGDVKLGQGVYGMRRALVVAGAETVVMSLWKVDDETTELLMDAYYRNLLSGKGRTAALRQAMHFIQQKRPHPHYWAPFISLGRDTPLQLPKPGR